MCARTDIFAKPSITQYRETAKGDSPKTCFARISMYIKP